MTNKASTTDILLECWQHAPCLFYSIFTEFEYWVTRHRRKRHQHESKTSHFHPHLFRSVWNDWTDHSSIHVGYTHERFWGTSPFLQDLRILHCFGFYHAWIRHRLFTVLKVSKVWNGKSAIATRTHKQRKRICMPALRRWLRQTGGFTLRRRQMWIL